MNKEHELQETLEILPEFFYREICPIDSRNHNWTEEEMVREIKRLINNWKHRWAILFNRSLPE